MNFSHCETVKPEDRNSRISLNFTATKILREINLGNYRVSKTAILTVKKVQIFEFWQFLTIFKSWNWLKKCTFRAYAVKKMAFFEPLNLPKLISRKNLTSRKFRKFQTVLHTFEITWNRLINEV